MKTKAMAEGIQMDKKRQVESTTAGLGYCFDETSVEITGATKW